MRHPRGNRTLGYGLVFYVKARWLAAVLVVATAGCDGGSAPDDVAPSPGTSATAAGCARPAPGSADVVARPGPTNGLPASPGGDALVIEAIILDRECRPAAGADLRIWHTDAQGRYGPADSERCCYYEGTVRTDQSGRFRLETIRPAQYPEANSPPAHVHLEIRHGSTDLATQFVFGIASPPATVAPAGDLVSVVLRRAGDGWHGDAVLVL
jgi:protocatechuate 3,4-dioxygenase beta subunit